MSPKCTSEVYWSRDSVSLTKFLTTRQAVSSRAVLPCLCWQWPTPVAEHFSGTEELTTNCTWTCSDSVFRQVFLFLTCLWGTPNAIQGLCSQGREAIGKWYFPQLYLSEKFSLTIHFPAGLCVTWWIWHSLRIFEFIIIPPTAAFSVAE